MKGTASCWDDIAGDILGRRLYATAGTVDWDWDENAAVFSPSGDISDQNDRVIFNIQVPHRTLVGSDLKPHIHIWQPDSTERTFTFQYRVQENGEAKETTWTQTTASLSTDALFSYTSGTLNQILKFPDISLSGVSLSAVIQCRITRTDANAGDVSVTFFDFHYNLDTAGSRQEYVK